jgi:arylsulfatase A-like enzyme
MTEARPLKDWAAISAQNRVLPPAKYVKLLEGQDPGLPEPLPDTLSAFERRVAEVFGVAKMAPEKLRAARLHYYAQVAWVDAQVGRVMAFLERSRTRCGVCYDRIRPVI